ncbi:hypothetical protein ASZ90_008426 [hydrocarbon metagenome]|uniref:Uncharacterized protein n=1 Tax=hydrocarbon metagenome TaxID=938273 RepID=A0A0W8FMD8_9ZZZZ
MPEFYLSALQYFFICILAFHHFRFKNNFMPLHFKEYRELLIINITFRIVIFLIFPIHTTFQSVMNGA